MIDLFAQGYAHAIDDALTMLVSARTKVNNLVKRRKTEEEKQTLRAICNTLDLLIEQVDIELMPHDAFACEKEEQS